MKSDKTTASEKTMTPDNDASKKNQTTTVSGYYESRDGRVSGHKFPVTIQLLADGKVNGTYESWLEERLLNGETSLHYEENTFSGTGTLKDNVLTIQLDKGSRVPTIDFQNEDGITLKFVYE